MVSISVVGRRVTITVSKHFSPPILTFDDGPGPSTSELLITLKKSAFHVIFFALGKNLARFQEIAFQIIEQGHVLGNHGWSHARPDALSDDELAQEIDATDALIHAVYAAVGRSAPAVIPLRLPYGVQDGDPRSATLARLGRQHIGWTMLADDWMRPPPSADVLAAAMLSHLDAQVRLGHPAVFCLHDSSRNGEARPETIDAVRLLLGELRRRERQVS